MAVLGEEARKLHLQGKKRMGLVKEEGFFCRDLISALQKPAELPSVQDTWIKDHAFEVDKSEPKVENPRPHAANVTWRVR